MNTRIGLAIRRLKKAMRLAHANGWFFFFHAEAGIRDGRVTGVQTCALPISRGVRLEGDFNSWDGREHPMRALGESGVWELFVPGVGSGTGYKYVVLGADGEWREKADRSEERRVGKERSRRRGPDLGRVRCRA